MAKPKSCEDMFKWAEDIWATIECDSTGVSVTWLGPSQRGSYTVYGDTIPEAISKAMWFDGRELELDALQDMLGLSGAFDESAAWVALVWSKSPEVLDRVKEVWDRLMAGSMEWESLDKSEKLDFAWEHRKELGMDWDWIHENKAE